MLLSNALLLSLLASTTSFTSAFVVAPSLRPRGLSRLSADHVPLADDVKDDVRTVLDLLNRRLDDLPVSSSDFRSASDRIIADLRERESAAAYAAPPPPPAQGFAPPPSPISPPPSPPPPQGEAFQPKEDQDEGPAYTGSGGMGMAKGTRSTYTVEGMEDMSPAEYRLALQKSVIDRQSQRRSAVRGQVGNKAANNYLDNLKSPGDAPPAPTAPVISQEDYDAEMARRAAEREKGFWEDPNWVEPEMKQ